LEDRVLRTDTPILGQAIVVPNRRHHTDPLDFTTSPLVSRNLPTWTIVIALSGLWFLMFGPSVFWFFMTLGGMVVNEVHRWAHVPSKTLPIIRTLQDTGLIQSPHHHAGHH